MNSSHKLSSFYCYLPSFVFGIIALLSAHYKGLSFYFLFIFSFVIIPLLELFLPPISNNVKVKRKLPNSLVPILIVPLNIYILYVYLNLISTNSLSTIELIGAWFTLGIICGVYGINVAHELGHRNCKWKQFLAQILLMTSLYMHFFIEHNRGHHKRVGTKQDPATALKNESVYSFWRRCIYNSFISAYNIEKLRVNKLNLRPILHNKFIHFVIIEACFIAGVYAFFGTNACIFFVLSAGYGILLLETINYIEHYGLLRKKIATGVFEKVNETHSWNSNHILGRYLLFELTRHSHHHHNSQKEYYELESMPKSNQLPTGYPGMMLISLIPPLFFKTMNKRLTS